MHSWFVSRFCSVTRLEVLARTVKELGVAGRTALIRAGHFTSLTTTSTSPVIKRGIFPGRTHEYFIVSA
jgi:hypothetical protein